MRLHKFKYFVLIGIYLQGMLLLSTCVPIQGMLLKNIKEENILQESEMVKDIEISDVQFDRAFYHPGEPVKIAISIETQFEQKEYIKVRAKISSLISEIEELQGTFVLGGDTQSIELSWSPPQVAPKGYGIDLCIVSMTGEEIDCVSKAIDVLNTWTETPRYGFLSDFYAGRDDASHTMQEIAKYHINGLQFYDWMYRHEQFLTDQEPYRDPLNRELSIETVENLISAAHERNIAAMPYTAIYAASIPFYEQHKDWVLFGRDGKPLCFGNNFLVYMDPRPDSPWVKYLLDQFDQILEKLPFDGIHLDQYGDPKQGYDVSGDKFNLEQPFAETINLTKELVLKHRKDGAVVFNAVTNWPVETVAPSNQDFVYIEVWPPYIWFDDLHILITQAQTLGAEKPVVLAAYIDPALEHNVRLMDAIIFASGGGHIELGESNAMLADAYFPKYKVMTPELAEVVQRYYDFVVRYQDAIGPRSRDATPEFARDIQVEGASTSTSLRKNKVWPIVRQSEEFIAINLINLCGVDSIEWAEAIESAPLPLATTKVRLTDLENEIEGIWFASPDDKNISPMPLDFIKNDEGSISFEIPSLKYWGLVLLKIKG